MATEKLMNHPKIRGVILGIIAEDGEFRMDAAAYISEEDFKKESGKFIKFRNFVLKEKEEHIS